MESTFYLGMNFIGMMVLCIVYFHVNSLLADRFTDQKLFRNLLLMVILFFLFDTSMYLLDGKQFPFAREVYSLCTSLYYIFCTMPCLCWLLYSDYKLNNNKKSLMKWMPVYSIPAVLNGFLAITSPATGWSYMIDEQNRYSRGPYVWMTWLFSFSYVAIIYVVWQKKNKDINTNAARELHNYLILFPLSSIIGAILQMFFGIALIGVGMLVGILIVFINVQNRRLYVDELTGAFNRRYLEVYLESAVKSVPKERQLFALVTDIVDLKGINDTRGRNIGDYVLMEVYRLLDEIFQGSGTIARFGGDEFVVLDYYHQSSEIDDKIKKIENKLNDVNENHKAFYEIKLNIGRSVYLGEERDTSDEFLKRADDEMYYIKHQRQEDLRRVEEYQRLLTEVTQGMYENIYELDITHNCAGDKSTQEYFESIGIPGTTPFNQALKHIAKKQIKEEYQQGYLDTFSPRNVLRVFREGTDSISYDFMITRDGANYYWLRITARIFFWEHDHSVRMLTYRQNIEEEKRRELEPLERAKKLEEELAQNRIAIMLSQIQPHFLYNSLVVIKQLCDIDPKEAKEAITEFSSYLRGNLDALTRSAPISFEQEMEHVETYLALEKKRFGEKIHIEYDIKAKGFFLPVLSLQPIVENAVRYGITKTEEGGTLTIASREEEHAYLIIVSDSGMGVEPTPTQFDKRSHVGMENVRNRLQSMCGGNLYINSVAGEGTKVTIEIPKEEENA